MASKKIILIPALLLSFYCYSQDSSTIKIKLTEFGVDFYPSNCDSTYDLKLSNGDLLTVRLFDCKGKMDVVRKNRKNKVLSKGQYIGSLDVLRAYRTANNATTQKRRIVVVEYYQPLQDGIWYYFDSTGKIIKKEHYNQGILIIE